MNYIHQIKGFWVAQDAHSLSVEEVGLYFHLLEISNKLNWMNPFKRNNSKIMADLGIKSLKTLSKHRNRLQQAGIITVVTRNGEANASYKLNDLGKIYAGLGAGLGAGSGVGLGTGLGAGSGADNTNINSKPNQTNSEDKSSGGKASTSSRKKSTDLEKKETTEHWQPLVEVWFDFYKQYPGKGEKPTFEGPAPKSLKKIVEWLQKRSAAKGFEWNEQNATYTLKRFLELAYSQEWLHANFLLPNLEKQFDKIVNQSKDGKGPTNGKPAVTSDFREQLAAKLSGN